MKSISTIMHFSSNRSQLGIRSKKKKKSPICVKLRKKQIFIEHQFIHSLLQKYLLNTCYVPDAVLGIEDGTIASGTIFFFPDGTCHFLKRF